MSDHPRMHCEPQGKSMVRTEVSRGDSRLGPRDQNGKTVALEEKGLIGLLARSVHMKR